MLLSITHFRAGLVGVGHIHRVNRVATATQAEVDPCAIAVLVDGCCCRRQHPLAGYRTVNPVGVRDPLALFDFSVARFFMTRRGMNAQFSTPSSPPVDTRSVLDHAHEAIVGAHHDPDVGIRLRRWCPVVRIDAVAVAVVDRQRTRMHASPRIQLRAVSSLQKSLLLSASLSPGRNTEVRRLRGHGLHRFQGLRVQIGIKHVARPTSSAARARADRNQIICRDRGLLPADSVKS